MHRGLLVVGVQLQDGDRAELPRGVDLHVGLPPHPLILVPVNPNTELHGARVALATVADRAPQPVELAVAAIAGAGEAAAAKILPAQHLPHGPAAQHLAQRGPQAGNAAPAGTAAAAAPPLLEPVVAEPEQPPARGCCPGRGAAAPVPTSITAAPGPPRLRSLDEERLLLLLQQLREPPRGGHRRPSPPFSAQCTQAPARQRLTGRSRRHRRPYCSWKKRRRRLRWAREEGSVRCGFLCACEGKAMEDGGRGS
uniref:Uncharacterized protein n=1 Tax=Arundo donax TaxID=35708 RepID=A0A0A9F8Z9_ARUDO